jgi:archaellum component FlaC
LFKNKKLKELEDRLLKVSEEATVARLKAEAVHDSIKDIYTNIFMIKERMNIIDSRIIDLEYDVKGLKRNLSELDEKLKELEQNKRIRS